MRRSRAFRKADSGVSRRRRASAGRDDDAMTMYLSNRDLRPTGYEPGEFIEPSTYEPPADPRCPEVDDEDDEDAGTSTR
jgi:hypothetical protein